MNLENSILKDVREAVGLDKDAKDFDPDLIMYINGFIGELNQNGIGKFIEVKDETQTWEELQDETQVEGNKYFKMVMLFITVSTKILFDPPPPSSVEYHSETARKFLWRLKIAYEVMEDDTGR